MHATSSGLESTCLYLVLHRGLRARPRCVRPVRCWLVACMHAPRSGQHARADACSGHSSPSYLASLSALDRHRTQQNRSRLSHTHTSSLTASVCLFPLLLHACDARAYAQGDMAAYLNDESFMHIWLNLFCFPAMPCTHETPNLYIASIFYVFILYNII